MRFTSGERVSLDSNILVYSVDRDAGSRHERAIEVVDRCVELDCVLALQALAEFYFVATRKGKMPHADAAAQVTDWQDLFPAALPGPDTVVRATAAVRDHRLSFWDAMLWAVAARNGVDVLLSEDLQDGRTLSGVRFVDPFSNAKW
jgi:predicted nucleic acid-binding protein